MCVTVPTKLQSVMKLIDFTVSTFFFPTDVTVLLSLTFFLNMVAETMPPTSERPLIGKENSPSLILQICYLDCRGMWIIKHWFPGTGDRIIEN